MKSGDRCQACKAALMRVRSSWPKTADWQYQQLECPKCGCKSQCLVPASSIKRRQKLSR